MNSRQESKLNMYNALLRYFENNNTALAGTPALTAALTALKTNVSAITVAVQGQMRNTSGMSMSKNQNSDALVILANSVAGSVHAWAAVTKNTVLKQEMKTTASALRKLRDEELVPVCKQFYDAASANKTDLEDYGITDALLTALQNAITAYNSTVPAPRNAIAQKKSYRNNIQALFKAADALIKERVDKIMLNIGLEKPVLADEYHSNRLIVDNGGTVTQLKASVLNGSSDIPVTGATITLKEAGITVTGNSKGQVLLKPAPGGMFTVLVEAPGYKPQTIAEYRIVTGQVNTLAVELKAA